MVSVRTITWEEASAPGFETTTRQAWREAVAEIAAKAKAKLPECSGRVDSAVKIVLAGDVDLQADGTAKVASQSKGTTAYHVVNGQCDCKDFAKAPHGFCKHRLAAAIARRAQELVKAKVAAPEGHAEAPSHPTQPEPPTVPLPEAPVSITLKATLNGHEVMVTLRGTDFASVKAQVEAASTWLQTQSGPAAETTPQCPKHGVPLKLNHGKNGSTWYSHKTADG
jgi:SWIM zinc finger